MSAFSSSAQFAVAVIVFLFHVMSCLDWRFVVVILRGEKVKKRDQEIVMIASYELQRGLMENTLYRKIPGIVDGETVRVFDGMSVRTYEREDDGWEWLTAH